MPMYEIERVEYGEFYKTFRVIADDEETALEQIFEDEVKPSSAWFKQRDADTDITQVPDCDCDECERRGPWACQEEDDE